MHPELRAAFEREMRLAREHVQSGRLEEAFSKLERAHVLGQGYVGAHTSTHYWMLRVGIRRRDLREIIGQLLRIPTGALGSALGLVPRGNTGGADVSVLARLPIPDDLKRILDLDS
ncbi:MAG: DUF3703 domain-containing protein [Planctomycetes bacterium]|nr:DUF3703 domain-containing protein [Planctomycetota bacterium]